MKVYLITDEQIMGLYASGTAGSRNFERVIEEVKRQGIKLKADGTFELEPIPWDGVPICGTDPGEWRKEERSE